MSKWKEYRPDNCWIRVLRKDKMEEKGMNKWLSKMDGMDKWKMIEYNVLMSKWLNER